MPGKPSRRREGPQEEQRVRVWDLPTRLVHWLIVALFAFSWWTIENDHLDWHMLSGYGMLVLVLFRLYWGFAGSTASRFASFVRGPRAVLAYASKLFDRRGSPVPGHNPMGGWSVMALLALLLTQTGLGLFAVDEDGINPGPLSTHISFDMGRRVAHWHGTVFNILLAFTALHIAAIAFYWFYRHENLISAMIGGKKRMTGEANHPAPRFAPLWRVLPGLAFAVAIVATIVFGRF